MVHEVTSPVAFLGLKNRNIGVLFPEKTFATADHNTPTINQHLPVEDPLSANQLKALEENSKLHRISFWGLGHKKKWNSTRSWPGIWNYSTWCYNCMWRFSYFYTRSLWSYCIWNWNIRSRNGIIHPVHYAT
jgi:hypothetical protein